MSLDTATASLTTTSLRTPLIVPLRNIFITLALTVTSLALSGFVWREQGYEMLIVTMGWPHVILGFVFYFGKVVRGDARMRTAFVMLALVTVTFWLVHYNYAITGLIYLYFLYHAFRDEITVYLQTRALHRRDPGLYAVAGVGPAILLVLLIPQQQDFRHDLRRAELTDAQIARDGWTLVEFRPVLNSRGRDFYFYLQSPPTEGARTLTTKARTGKMPGNLLVNDRAGSANADFAFEPHYVGMPAPASLAVGDKTAAVLLTGGHRVGQAFRAEQDNLDGIFLPIDRNEAGGTATNLVFHLASPPMLPYPAAIAKARSVLIVLLSALVLWKLWPRRGSGNQLWIYLLIIAVVFTIIQITLKRSNHVGYNFPLIFQFVVVVHYWSWYVFSFDKLRTMKTLPPVAPRNAPGGRYDRVLARLRPAGNFWTITALLNLISAAGVFWYYKGGGPPALRFAFDYQYFLYFLVFHVTFSFSPKLSPAKPVNLRELRAG